MRLLKQLFFVIIWLVVLGGVGYLGYRILTPPPPQPTCGDNCLPSDLKPISVRGSIKIVAVATSSDHASILVQLQNLNVDYAAKNFDYDLKLSGKNGWSADLTGNSFMYAGELKYLAFSNVEVGEPALNLTADFQIQNPDWAKDADFHKPTIFLQSQNTATYADRVEVAGKFTNGDPATLEKATIIAVLFDTRGSIIGVSQTETANIASGEARAFTVVHPFVSGVNVSATQVFVYPYR
jgi:hypothetical protein